MESLLAGYKLLFLFSRYLYLLVEVVIKVSIQSVLVVNLEEDERSMCLAAPFRREDIDQILLLYLTEVMMCQAKILLFVVNCRL